VFLLLCMVHEIECCHSLLGPQYLPVSVGIVSHWLLVAPEPLPLGPAVFFNGSRYVVWLEYSLLIMLLWVSNVPLIFLSLIPAFSNLIIFEVFLPGLFPLHLCCFGCLSMLLHWQWTDQFSVLAQTKAVLPNECALTINPSHAKTSHTHFTIWRQNFSTTCI